MARQPSSATGGNTRKKVSQARDVAKKSKQQGVSSKRAARKGGRMSWLMSAGK